MKILHTSDLHLGKKLEGRDRIDEQRQVLEEILNIIQTNNVEIVICAGDVFDSYIPQAQAEQLFYEYAKKFADNGRAFVVISGNHDEGERLSASNYLSQELNIFIVSSQKTQFKTGNKSQNVTLIESGNGFLVFENNKREKVFISLLPYPTYHRYKEEVKEVDFNTQMGAWLSAGSRHNTNNLPEILVAHIFALGGEKSSGERDIELGGARIVHTNLFPKCQYVALGHLHKLQAVAKNAYYSGSILQYAFDEAASDKFVITFDITQEKEIENFTKHKLSSGKRLVRLTSSSLQNAAELIEKYKDSFIEITIKLSSPLTAVDLKELNKISPNLVSVIPEIEQGENARQSRKNFNHKEMFIAYYKAKFNDSPSDELLTLYLKIMDELQ